MTADSERADLIAEEAAGAAAPPLRQRWGHRLRWLATLGFSSLTRRIVVLNLAGLVALLAGILYLNQFRAGLIDAKIQSLLIQGEIIAGAVAASATVDTNQIWVDPNKLLSLDAGQSVSPGGEYDSLEFPINPERVAPVLRRLITPTHTRARIYDREGNLLLNSQNIYRGNILQLDLPPPAVEPPGLLQRIYETVRGWLLHRDLPLYEELGSANGKGYPEVVRALQGSPATMVRANARGEIIVSVAVPIQRFRAVTGTLLLSTQGGDIDAIVAAERTGIVRVFLVAAAVMVVLSVLLAGTIAGPVRRLAAAAERVRHRDGRGRAEIPDFTERSDEIGHLSGALRDMTGALYQQIEAIERFAADVAHELKNPLTSLRSAVETLPLAKSAESRERLIAVIQHDVRRLDRLITDISDASRLDAELQRQDSEPVDIAMLLDAVTDLQNQVAREDGVRVALTLPKEKRRRDRLIVFGHDSRLAQVITNLVENARSFSPPGGEVRVVARPVQAETEITVEDDGPGIRPDALTRIFERFYTDRPEQGFGQNSGLGLSISKQIVEAHDGRIWAENRYGPPEAPDAEPPILGARFVVRLPAAVAH